MGKRTVNVAEAANLPGERKGSPTFPVTGKVPRGFGDYPLEKQAAPL